MTIQPRNNPRLQDYIAHQRNRPANHEATLTRVIVALDAFHAKHGLLSDEFSTL